MNKFNYYLKINLIFVIFLFTSCSLFKNEEENVEQKVKNMPYWMGPQHSCRTIDEVVRKEESRWEI